MRLFPNSATRNSAPRKNAILICVVAAALLAGCATAPPRSDVEAYREYKKTNDPMEPLNRGVFAFNDAMDHVIAKPLAQGYKFITPKFLRNIISNILDNLEEPLTLVNDILQGEFNRAGVSLGRFVTNSTIGVGGMFEVAEDLGMERHEEDFGQTFAVWGVPTGPYVVLPFFGPSSVRGSFGEAADFFGDPVGIVLDQVVNESGLSLAITGADVLDARTRNLDTVEELKKGAIDFYATARSAYRQNRAADIRNGERPDDTQEEEDIFDDFEDIEESRYEESANQQSALLQLRF